MGVGRVFANVRVIRRPVGRLAPELWRDGLNATDSPLVAFSTAAIVPAPGWLDAMLARLAETGAAFEAKHGRVAHGVFAIVAMGRLGARKIASASPSSKLAMELPMNKTSCGPGTTSRRASRRRCWTICRPRPRTRCRNVSSTVTNGRWAIC